MPRLGHCSASSGFRGRLRKKKAAGSVVCCDGGGGCGRLDDFDVAVGADLEFLSNAENFEALADVPALALKYMGVGHSRVLAEGDK